MSCLSVSFICTVTYRCKDGVLAMDTKYRENGQFWQLTRVPYIKQEVPYISPPYNEISLYHNVVVEAMYWTIAVSITLIKGCVHLDGQ